MRSPTTPGFSPSPACPTRRTPPSWPASTWRSWARRRTTSSPTARARASARARSARPRCPPGPHLEAGIDAHRGAAVVDFGDAPVLPADPVRTHAAIEALVGQVRRRGRAADHPRRRPLDRRARHPRDRHAPRRPGRADPLRHPHRHRPGGLRRRALARLDHVPARRAGPRGPEALRPDRPARLLAGRDRVRLAARARHHVAVHARRPRVRHPLRRRARARRSSAPARCS